MPGGSEARFVMRGARDAMAAGLLHIEQQVQGIELAIQANPGLVFDLAKVLVESACKAILAERSIEAARDDLPSLFRTATRSVPILPADAGDSGDVRKSLKQTLGGLHAAVQGLCELRNRCGYASHGGATPAPAMETAQALLAAATADAIVGFLYCVHREDHVRTPSRAMRYDDNPEFNDHVDDLHEWVRIFDSEFQPSDVLFTMEPETYRLYLTEFKTAAEDDAGEADPRSGEAA